MKRHRVPPSQREVMGSEMRENHWLSKEVNTTYQRGDETFTQYFTNIEIEVIETEKLRKEATSKIVKLENIVKKNVSFCNNIEALFGEFGVEHDPNEWRLFMDGSTESLKIVLLHNQNSLPSIPLAYSTHCPEQYLVMRQILDLIHYENYQWDVIADFKLVNILQGLMAAAAKTPCIHCKWEPRYQENEDDDIYTKTWEEREPFSEDKIGKESVKYAPLVPRNKMIFPVLHIKIGLVTQLFKIIQAHPESRTVLLKMFGKSEAKITGAVYNGPEIRELFKNKELENTLSEELKEALTNLKLVCENFLGNKRAENYRELINNLMKSYKELGCRITVKMHSLICHLDLFPENCGAMSDEQGERFHQTLKHIEEAYKGKNMAHALGKYCSELIRYEKKEHNRKSPKKKTEYFYKDKD